METTVEDHYLIHEGGNYTGKLLDGKPHGYGVVVWESKHS